MQVNRLPQIEYTRYNIFDVNGSIVYSCVNASCFGTHSLGSTRFFKVAKGKHNGALIVIKVFILHDPTLPLVEHKDKLDFLYRELSPKNNCLPFTKALVTELLYSSCFILALTLLFQ